MINKIISASVLRVIQKCHERGISGSSIASQFSDWLQKNDLQEDWVGETKKTEETQLPPIVRKGAIRVMVDSKGDIVSQGELNGELAENNILSMNPSKSPHVSPEDEDFLDPTAGPKDPEEEEEEKEVVHNRDDFFKHGIAVEWKENGKTWTGTAYHTVQPKIFGDDPTVFCECNEDGLFKYICLDRFIFSSADEIKEKLGSGE